NQDPALAPRLGPQLWPGDVPPPADGRLVPLAGPADRHLRGPAQLGQQPADVPRGVPDPEFIFNHSGDAGAGPDLAAEPVRLRAVPEELGDLSLRGCRQPGRRAGRGRRRRAHGPCSRARASHWLTDTSDTPRASAMSRWTQPRLLRATA